MKLCFTSTIPETHLSYTKPVSEGLLGAHFALPLPLLFLASSSASFT